MDVFTNPPPPPGDPNELAAFYRDAALRINAELLQITDAESLTYVKRQALLREVERILRELDESAAAWIEENLPQSYSHGQATTLLTLGKVTTIAEAIDIVGNIGVVNERAVAAMVRDSLLDLNAATREVRRNIADRLRYATLTNDKARNAGHGIAADLRNAGVDVVRDKIGRRWRLDVYAHTVAKTKLADARREGILDQADEEGFDVAVISAHGATDSCRRFEHSYVSLRGKTPGLPTLAQLKNSRCIFHVNCSHQPLVCDPKLLPPSIRRKAEAKKAEVEESLRLAEEGKLNSHGLKKGA